MPRTVIINKKKNTAFIILISIITAIAIISLTSCMGGQGGLMPNRNLAQENEESNTARVEVGDIIKEIAVTGSVEARTTNTLIPQVSGNILWAAEVGDEFKEGDLLIEIDSSNAAQAIVDMETQVELARNSLSQAQINYQSALDSNHIAVQMADLDKEKAELSAQSALQSYQEAKELADISSANAQTALEISQNSFNNSVISLEQAQQNLEYAQKLLSNAKADSSTTSEQIMQLEDNVNTASKNVQKTELALESSELSLQQAENSKQQTEIQSGSQVGSGEISYQQSLKNQSSTYWSTLESMQNGQKQIKLANLSMQKAKIDLKMAETELELAGQELAEHTIYAPYQGMVVATDFKPGEETTGAKTISIIEDDYMVDTLISESELVNISEGAEAVVSLDAYPGVEFKGIIEKIIRIPVEENQITYYETWISFEDTKDIEIIYGLSASISIVTEKAEDVLYVPIRAVYTEQDKNYVNVAVQAEEGQMTPKKTEITTGINDYYNIEVISGLKRGDVVITSR